MPSSSTSILVERHLTEALPKALVKGLKPSLTQAGQTLAATPQSRTAAWSRSVRALPRKPTSERLEEVPIADDQLLTASGSGWHQLEATVHHSMELIGWLFRDIGWLRVTNVQQARDAG